MLRRRMLALSPLLLLTGCLPLQLLDSSATDEGSPMVPTSPFGTRAPVVMKPVSSNFAPAAWDSAMRVDRVSKVLVAANPAVGKPLFGTIGDPRPEIFHQGTQAVQITEGLVKKCKDDGQLAAVLSLELGKMVSEREALAGAKARALQERLPQGVAVGNSGGTGPSDMVALAEQASREQQRQRLQHARPPDPQALARGYLEKIGFGKRELDAVAPLLEAAEKNYVFEKQFKSSPDAPAWSPGPQQ